MDGKFETFRHQIFDSVCLPTNVHPQVRVTFDDEPGPENFTKVSRDLVKGGASGRRAYLWLRRQTRRSSDASTSPAETPSPSLSTTQSAKEPLFQDKTHAVDGRSQEDGVVVAEQEGGGSADVVPSAVGNGEDSAQLMIPIGEVVVAFGKSDPNDEDALELAAAVAAEKERSGEEAGAGAQARKRRPWERLERSLNPGVEAGKEDVASGVFLWYRRGSEDAPLPWSSRSLTVGLVVRILTAKVGVIEVPMCVCCRDLLLWCEHVFRGTCF